MRLLSILIILFSTLYAASDAEINALIDEVVHASSETRYEKMNAFKLKMRELNTQQRGEALRALQSKAYPELDPSKAVRLHGQTVGQRPDKKPTSEQQMRMQQHQYGGQKQGGSGTGGGPNQPVQPPGKHNQR